MKIRSHFYNVFKIFIHVYNVLRGRPNPHFPDPSTFMQYQVDSVRFVLFKKKKKRPHEIGSGRQK